MKPIDKPSAGTTKPQTSAPNIQGEGDYEATRRFDKDAERFLKNADVPELAKRAAPKSKEEAAELEKAEQIGRSHSAATGKEADVKSPQRAAPTVPRD
jgi:hypothetical protein